MSKEETARPSLAAQETFDKIALSAASLEVHRPNLDKPQLLFNNPGNLYLRLE